MLAYPLTKSAKNLPKTAYLYKKYHGISKKPYCSKAKLMMTITINHDFIALQRDCVVFSSKIQLALNCLDFLNINLLTHRIIEYTIIL